MHSSPGQYFEEYLVQIPTGSVTLEGNLEIGPPAAGVVIFAHGSGSSRFSPRNRFVAKVLREAGMAMLLLDLLTPSEEDVDKRTSHLRFDIGLLARRLVGATDWLVQRPDTHHLPIGYFGASTGAAAALIAAAQRSDLIRAIVSRGGRPDLAGAALAYVQAPTLFIVGGEDTVVLDLNREALAQLPAVKALQIVSRASHLFEEPGALEEVARLAAQWFRRYLVNASAPSP
ncbi:MAG: alpha/beta hydrolase [Chloroflexi bacterium]|nr:alpha/beta hydrolase [Chloroflexota bacterium]